MTPELYFAYSLALGFMVAGQALGFKIASGHGMILSRLRVNALKPLDNKIERLGSLISSLVQQCAANGINVNDSIDIKDTGYAMKSLHEKQAKWIKRLKPFGQCMPCTAGSTLTTINMIFLASITNITVGQFIWLFIITSFTSTLITYWIDSKLKIK